MKQFNTTVELHDLGEFNDEWQGILSPLYDDGLTEKYIHAQFLNEASAYVENYQNLEYWRFLLKQAQAHLSFDSAHELKILDIGSGGGNTLFPLFELYPDAAFVASDLSVPLLKLLKQHYEQSYSRYSCEIVQLNAEELIFEENQFDLIVGAAILHHLFVPEKTLEQCFKILKPGGYALFFEPFELGNQIIVLILKQLLEKNKHFWLTGRRLPLKVVRLFKTLCRGFELRKGTDKTGEKLRKLDDKWFFTKSYFEDTGVSAGFSEIRIYPLHDTATIFSDQIKTYLRTGLQTNESLLPPWAEKHLAEMDEHFSPELRRELFTEAGILLRK